MGTLEIKLFGTLRVQRSGRPVMQFPARRTKDLLGYLLLNRHMLHPREVVADLLWDPERETNPRHCLNTALWRLQRVLGEPDAGEHPYLRVDAKSIGFNTASNCRLDIAEFENRCELASQVGTREPDRQAMLYQQALAFYHADLLVDCYEEWCVVERERLRRMYIYALEFMLEHHARQGDFPAATDYATRLLACDPLREDVQRRLMTLHLQSGHPAAALRQYRSCEAVIRQELGVALSSETQQLLPRILLNATTTSGDAQGAHVSTSTLDRMAPTIVQLRAGGDGDPTTALASLHAAVAELDRAHAHLREAAACVEAMASRLIGASAGSAN